MQRGGGMQGGGMQRGGGMQGGGMQRGGGGMQGGGMQRGGGGMQGGGMQRGGGFGGGASHSPSMSQPRSQANGSGSGGRNPYANNSGSSGRNPYANNAGESGRNANSSDSNTKAAAGAGYANRNQNPNAAPAAAGAGYANRNQNPHAAPAAAGAGYANRNQSQFSNAGAAAAGAGYANNQSNFSNAGAAAAGASYANNQNNFSNAGAAAAGASYANRNQYDRYHPGMAAGTWNGNYGVSAVGGYGGVGAWGMGSPAYGYGYSSYNNPYSTGAAGGGAPAQPADAQQQAAAPGYDYSQPLNTAAAPPDQAAADQGSSAVAQARQSFQAGDYDTALQLTQQGLGQMPNDATLHEFLGLVLFAQGNYEQAAAPIYAVLSVGPGWDWTTLISNYPDADVYTRQLRGLEAFVRANPKSARAQFVLAYQYLSQGQGEAAIKPLESVVALQPDDTVSAQLLAKLQPAAAPADAPVASAAPPSDPGDLKGTWVAQPPNAKITLTLGDDGAFSWAANAPDKPPITIKGKSTLADGVLTLSSDQPGAGDLAGDVTRVDDQHFAFRAVGAPPDDPGLKFAR
jgi:protein involved in temperature-dependent protein secretion